MRPAGRGPPRAGRRVLRHHRHQHGTGGDSHGGRGRCGRGERVGTDRAAQRAQGGRARRQECRERNWQHPGPPACLPGRAKRDPDRGTLLLRRQRLRHDDS